MVARASRPTVTVGRLMVAVAIAALLLVPVRLADRARKAALRQQCPGTLRQIGIALHRLRPSPGSGPGQGLSP